MSRFIQCLIVVASLASLASTLAGYPHELAYFNELAGGPQRGSEHLLHSNLDWGQDLLLAAEWQRSHPSKALVAYSLLFAYDPRFLGIRGLDLHRPNWCENLLESARGETVTILVSKQIILEKADCFSKFNTEVIDSIGMSIVVIQARARLPHE